AFLLSCSPPSLPYFFFLVTRRPPRSPLFPYTTLFRSSWSRASVCSAWTASHQARHREKSAFTGTASVPRSGLDSRGEVTPFAGRSEEHTSELQSLTNLVCRLLLEKKKPSPNDSH